MSNKKYTFYACGIAFGVNFLLFIIKLYIGLRSNSISIFSDAVNNLFDSLSGFLTLTFMFWVLKKSTNSNLVFISKVEQLLSFLISIPVLTAGLYFAYSSLERIMYPAPVWFTINYAYILCATAVVKILMYFIYNKLYKKGGSPIINVMKTDCILDFFVTFVTILTLLVSNYGTFSFDSYLGIVISILIIISAFKMIIESGKSLTDYIGKNKIEILNEILNENNINEYSVNYLNDGNKDIAYVKTSDIIENTQDLKQIIFKETGIYTEFLL